MKKGHTALGAFLGSLVAAGLFVLLVWLGSTLSIGFYIPLMIVAWLIGGIISGLIATTPGKGALAGFLASIFMFLLNTIVFVLLTVIVGEGLFTVIFEIITLGFYDPSLLPSGVIIILALIGLLVSFILSAISAIFMVAGGAIGGAIVNPKKSQKNAYQEYPVDNLR
ncbi:MAG: hypothetical protein JXA54_13160 [Candidatus Heimdallarchaeota archaeon]|nr:hypothetical protein [Candidatus Heimdallarchaeota archaeon]